MAASCDGESVSQADSPRPEAVAVEAPVDAAVPVEAKLPGGARSPLARPQTTQPVDAGGTPTCGRLKHSIAADTAACYRLMPDTAACTRVTENLSKMVELGCKMPDAGGPDAPSQSDNQGSRGPY